MKRWPPRQRTVEHCAQGVDVGARPQLIDPSHCLLGSHIARRSKHLASCRQIAAVLDPLGKSEIRHTRRAGLVQQDVAGFQVAVDHTLLVGELHRLTNLDHQGRGLARRQRVFGESGRQALAFNERHREIVLAFADPKFVDRHDTRMNQTGGRFGFDAKPLNVGFRGKVSAENHLHGDQPIQTHLPRSEDNAHPAAGDLFQQFVVAEAVSLCEPAQQRLPAARWFDGEVIGTWGQVPGVRIRLARWQLGCRSMFRGCKRVDAECPAVWAGR